MQITHVAEASYPRAATLSRAVLSGFIASLAMFFTFVTAYGMSLVVSASLRNLTQPVQSTVGPLLLTIGQWAQALTDNQLVSLAFPNVYVALAVHLAGGLVWAVVYAHVFEPRLNGPDWQRGLLFSLVPWLLSLVLFFPLAGAGFFGFGLGAGPLPMVGNLVLHAVYGVVLAEVYGPFGDRIDADHHEPMDEDLRALVSSEEGAARGLAVGMVFGAVLALGVLAIPPLTGMDLFSSTSPMWLMLATVLFGATFGAVIGSLAGLSRSARPRTPTAGPE